MLKVTRRKFLQYTGGSIATGLFAPLLSIEDIAAAAINFDSPFTGWESCAHLLAKVPVGTTKPPRGSADPDRLAPASNGGNTEPSDIARSGSSG